MRNEESIVSKHRTVRFALRSSNADKSYLLLMSCWRQWSIPWLLSYFRFLFRWWLARNDIWGVIGICAIATCVMLKAVKHPMAIITYYEIPLSLALIRNDIWDVIGISASAQFV